MTQQAQPSRPTTNASEETILEIEGLKKHFSQSGGVLDRLFGASSDVQAVDGVDLTVREGETLAIVGESGCGKSTLGKTILNLLEPTGGTIRYKGDDITGLTGGDMQPYRKHMQLIFQDPLASLNPRKTVGNILRTPLQIHGIASGDEVDERVAELLERVGLDPSMAYRFPRQLSGGQQQRVGIARALAVEPDLIVADEPVSELDVSVQAQILNLLKELQSEFNVSMMFIAHDLSVVRHIADRVGVMYLGRLVEVAPVDELFETPQHPYTKSLLSAVPRINPDDRTERTILKGSVPSPIDPPQGCRFHTRCPVAIPPAGWTGSQSDFLECFTFRNSVLENSFDRDAIRTRLESEGKDGSTEAIQSYILERQFGGDIESLPEEAATAIRDATNAIVNGDGERAKSIVRDTFSSPCERETPAWTSVSESHSATCHRIDSEHDADELTWQSSAFED